MDEMIKKLKSYLDKMDNKKFIQNFFIIILISVILLIGMSILKDNKNSLTSSVIKEKPYEYNSEVKADYESQLEVKLANILSKLKGAGKVEVMITLEDSIEKIPAMNTTKTSEKTKEIDSEGGSREVSREDESIQLGLKSSDGSVIVLKEIKPTIKGVIVVADGASDPIVLERLYEAVKTVLGVSGNKVNVYSSK